MTETKDEEKNILKGQRKKRLGKMRNGVFVARNSLGRKTSRCLV